MLKKESCQSQINIDGIEILQKLSICRLNPPDGILKDPAAVFTFQDPANQDRLRLSCQLKVVPLLQS